jgi:hypothetical protein
MRPSSSSLPGGPGRAPILTTTNGLTGRFNQEILP